MATKKRNAGTLTRVGKTLQRAAKTVAKTAGKAVKPLTGVLTGTKGSKTAKGKKKTSCAGSRSKKG